MNQFGQNQSKEQERLFKEEQTIRKAVGERLTPQQLDYYKNHPAMRGEDYPPYLMEHLSGHDMFRDAGFKAGKIVIEIDEDK